MKDHVRTLTRTATPSSGFTVAWDARSAASALSGEAEAKYDAELKVDNLRRYVPTPGAGHSRAQRGASYRRRHRRRFPIVGVLALDAGVGGTLPCCRR